MRRLNFPACNPLYGNTPLIARWHKGQDYFIVRLYRDLVGDWIVSQCWGNSSQGTSASTKTVVQTYQEGRSLLKEINQQQKTAGYRAADRDEIQLDFFN